MGLSIITDENTAAATRGFVVRRYSAVTDGPKAW
jgi:hypothetical protein